MSKLKFFLLGLCMIFALMACGEADVVDNNAEFLANVKGKVAKGNMQGINDVTYTWSADGKTLNFNMGRAAVDYTFVDDSATSPLKAVYLGGMRDAKNTDLELNADKTGGSLSTLPFTFE